MLALWRYFDLVRLVGSSSSGDSQTQHLPRETPEGGHESGAAIKADIDTALMLLTAYERRVAWDYYVAQKPEVVVAAETGSSRWNVHKTRLHVLRKMALSLGWAPRKPADADDEDMSRSAMRIRMTLILQQAFADVGTEAA